MLEEAIWGLPYLLDFQKEALIRDFPELTNVAIITIVDAIFWTLFQKSLKDLSDEEQRQIRIEIGSFSKEPL